MPVEYAPAVPSIEEHALESIERTAEALADLRESIRHTETTMRRALRNYRSERDIRLTLASFQPADVRELMNDSLESLERARHAARIAMFALALERGMSIAELARTWGFSRQLANRYAQEARTRADVATTH
jgi:transposase-like protein